MIKNILSLITLLYMTQINAQFQKASFPVAEKKEHWRTLHDDRVLDDYYWMYDYFGKGPDSTKVVDYLKAENNYLETVMAGTKQLQADLFTEMKSRIKEKDESVPVFKNGYYYYTRTEDGKQYYKYCRKKTNLNAEEEILLDVDKMAEGHSYFAVTGFDISEDNNLLAYGVDNVSRRQYTIYVKDLTTGMILKDAVANTEGDPCWANDNKTFFYTEKHPVTLLSEKILRHTLGNEAASDAVVYEEKDKSNYIGVQKSKNNKYIFIVSQATMSSEFRMINASTPNAAFTVFQPRMKDVLYSVYTLDDKFLIRTNKDGAKNFKLMECTLDKTDAANWKEVIPARTDVLLQSVEEFKNFIVINERKNGLVKMHVRSLKDNAENYIDFGESAYAANFGGNPEYNTNNLRYSYTSLTTPSSVYDYNMVTKEKKLMKQQEVLGGYNPKDYVTERLYVTAKDGTKIPVSLVYK
ncbi:MAG: oligopeptidase B, partial [Ginsengibacter sp.]